jgi:hypothetical protein
MPIEEDTGPIKRDANGTAPAIKCQEYLAAATTRLPTNNPISESVEKSAHEAHLFSTSATELCRRGGGGLTQDLSEEERCAECAVVLCSYRLYISVHPFWYVGTSKVFRTSRVGAPYIQACCCSILSTPETDHFMRRFY